MKTNRRIIAAMITMVLLLSVAAVPNGTTKSAAKKATIDSYYKTVNLVYDSHGDSRYMYNGQIGLESMINDINDKATYSVKIKNEKVATTGPVIKKDDLSKTMIYATGLGKTSAVIYEQVGNKKQTKIGSIKIKVKKCKLGEVVSSIAFGEDALLDSTVYLQPYMGKSTYDLGADIYNRLLNNDERGLHFKKSEYTATYKMNYFHENEDDETSPEIINAEIDPKTGVITAIKAGNAFVDFDLKFSDGSHCNWSLTIEVLDSSIVKEGKYTIDNIRDYIVGVDTPVELEDGTKTAQVCFDNASTTPALKPVEEELEKELLMYGSIGRGFSQKSNHCTDLYKSTRSRVLDFVDADHGKYTCFYVNSTTDGLNKLASALITSKKDIVLATRIEHHANDLSWRERCKMLYAEVDKQGRVKYDDLEKILKKNKNKIKLVAITAASNVTGYVTDVHRVAKMAHKYGAMIVVDGAQIVAHRHFSMMGDLNDPNDDIDFLAFSAHKMYSPFGGGAVVGVAKELYKHMPTFYGGGTVQIVGDSWVDYKENDIAVYEAGSPNYPGVIGLGKAIDVLSDVGFDAIQEHEKKLNSRLISGLKKLPNIVLYGDCDNIDDRVGVVTFNFTDVNSQLLAEMLSKLGAVATRRGVFCAHPYCWRLMGIPDAELKDFEGCADAKTPGMIRVSFGIYNTEEEVDKLLELLPKALDAARAEQENFDAPPEY